MNRKFLLLLAVMLLICAVPFAAFAEESEPFDETYYEELLEAYDLGVFQNGLDKDTYALLSSLGIENASLSALSSLSYDDAVSVVIRILKSKARAPLTGVLSVLAMVMLSSLLISLKGDGEAMGELYSAVSAVVIAGVLLVKISPTVTAAAAAIQLAADFIYAFIPVFITVVAASGGVTTAFATNSMLMLLSQGLSALAANLFMPLINCMLAVGICASLKRDLGLDGLVTGMKKVISGVLAFIAGVYVAVLSVRTSLSSRADVLGIRSARFVINSVIPVVGGAISEGLLSIESYSSLIKSSVGVVGIAAIVLVFLPSVLELSIWRVALRLAAVCSRLFGDGNTEGVLNAFSDAMLLMYAVMAVSALTTVVSLGILIAAGG